MCDDSFDLNDAHVFCRMAGYTEGAETAYTRSKPFGYGSSGSVFALDNLACKGIEQSVVNCKHAGWNKENCGTKEWAGVKCKGVKVVNGNNLAMVRLENHSKNTTLIELFCLGTTE